MGTFCSNEVIRVLPAPVGFVLTHVCRTVAYPGNNCLENVAVSTFRNPMGFHNLLQE
jgi:hypothetical protein